MGSLIDDMKNKDTRALKKKFKKFEGRAMEFGSAFFELAADYINKKELYYELIRNYDTMTLIEKKKHIHTVFENVAVRTYRVGLSKKDTCNILDQVFLQDVGGALRKKNFEKIYILPVLNDNYYTHKIILRNKECNRVYKIYQVENNNEYKFKFMYQKSRNKEQLRKTKFKIIKLLRKVFKRIVFKRSKYSDFTKNTRKKEIPTKENTPNSKNIKF